MEDIRFTTNIVVGNMMVFTLRISKESYELRREIPSSSFESAKDLS